MISSYSSASDRGLPAGYSPVTHCRGLWELRFFPFLLASNTGPWFLCCMLSVGVSRVKKRDLGKSWAESEHHASSSSSHISAAGTTATLGLYITDELPAAPVRYSLLLRIELLGLSDAVAFLI